MGKLITLKNGEIRTLLDTNDALDIVQEFLGDELADYLKSDFRDLEDAIDRIDSDKNSLETDCENYAITLFNAMAETNDLLKQFDALDDLLTSTRIKLENIIKETCME